MPVNNKNLSAFFFHPPFEQNFWPEILEEIYKKKVYLPYLPHDKKNTICVDIGANVGLTAYYFSQYFEKVIAVEPAKQHQDAIYAMSEQNNLLNLIVAPLALSNKDGTERFYHNPNQTMFSLEKTVNDTSDFEEVKTMAMDTFMKEYKIDHIDLLKLDMEGSESQFIVSDGFIKSAPKIKAIVGEHHQWTEMKKELFQHSMEKLGYKFKWRYDTQASVFEAIRI